MKRLIFLFFTISFLFLKGQVTNVHPCDAEVLCEAETLSNDYPPNGVPYTIKSSCYSNVTFDRTVFYKIVISQAGLFTFLIKPNQPTDYDWAVWKNLADCNAISTTTADRFSYSASNGNTGLTTTTTQTCEGVEDGFCSALPVVPGDEILIAIDLYSSGNVTYELEFGGSGGGGTATDFLCIDEYQNAYNLCDTGNDGTETINLNLIRDWLIQEYLGGNSNYTFTFYGTEPDVVINTNPITSVTVAPTKKVFVKIEDSTTGDLFGNVLAVDIILDTINVNLGADMQVCNSNSVTLNAGTFPPGTTFLWSTGQTTSTITISTSGTYSVVVTSPKGCSATDEINVFLSDFSIDLGEDKAICNAQSTTLSATGTFPSGTTFLWSTGQTTPTITISSPGTYMLTVTLPSGSGCTATDEINVSIENITIDLGADIEICDGLSATLDAGNFPPGTTFLWSTGETTQTINVSSPGNYGVTVTSPNGCTATDNVLVSFENITVSLGADIESCVGQSVTLNATGIFPNGSTFLWSTGEVTQSINVSSPGTYSVTVTSPKGCSGISEIDVSFESISVDLGADMVVCNEDFTTLDAGNFPPGTTFLWNTGETTQNITVSSSGNYSVTVTSPKGCSATDDVLVSFEDITVNLGADIESCAGEIVTLNAGNFPPGTTFLWNTGETTQSINVSSSGTYSVVVTSPDGCTATDEIDVSFEIITVDLGADVVVCNEDFTTLDAVGNFPVGTTFLWNTGETSQSITVSSSGNYSVTATSPKSCSATDDVLVSFQIITVDLGPDIIVCDGQSVTLDAGNFPAGTTFLWNTGETTQTIIVSSSGIYSVVVTSPEGCTATDEINVTIENVFVDFGEDIRICDGQPVTIGVLNYPAGSTFIWNTGETSPEITVSSTGTYTLTITSPNGCTATDEIFISIETIAVDLGADIEVCYGQSVTLDAGNFPAGTTFLWNTGETSQTITVTETDTYSVTVSYPSGCSATDEILVNFIKAPEIISIEITGNTVTINVAGGKPPYEYSLDGISWQSSNVFNDIPRGVHTAYVRGSMCPDNISEREFLIVNLINVITPNGDGKNDVMDYSDLRIMKDVSISVFDRYGQTVYKSSANNFVWNGKHANGRTVSSGTYWYVLKWMDSTNTPVIYKGWILVKNRN
ncbi:MAG: gliding motility-associated C-terminal domain-containing protein [Flavobacteriaceae bacterium]|nr:gliding motility-associated C-terminal domain-containing protein [Flavobacteriaceae bacterium]